MDPCTFIPFLLLLHLVAAQPLINPAAVSRITVAGVVYCDVCSTNTISPSTYFLSGVDVNIECKFNTKSSAKQISISANTRTDQNGIYKFDIPSSLIEGIPCIQGHRTSNESNCQATLINQTSSSTPSCNTLTTNPSSSSSSSSSTTLHEITIRSKQDTTTSLCIYSLDALAFTQQQQQQRQSESDGNFTTLCATASNNHPLNYSSLNSSEFFLPFFPPFGFFPWPFTIPFLPCPPLPKPPSLPFPFPPLPPLPTSPLLPPGFNLADPRTWVPAPAPPPPTLVFPPGFNIGDPRTWILPPPNPPNNNDQNFIFH